MLYRKLLHQSFVLLPMLTSSIVFAQEKDCKKPIVIWVEQHKTSKPIPGAQVVVDDQTAFTDDSGLVWMPLPCDLNLSQYKISVEGYTLSPKEIFHKGDTLLLSLRVNLDSQMLDEVSVKGTKKLKVAPNAQLTLSGEQLQRFQSGSIAAMASQLAGVNMLQTGAEIVKPMINGMANNRVLILNNGVRQEGQQWGAEHAPEIDGMNVSRLSVVKGAETVRYGRDAIGGVILVEAEPLAFGHKHWHGAAQMQASSNARKGLAAVKIEHTFGNKGQWAWRAQASGSRNGNYKTPDYYLGNTSGKSLNYSATLGYKAQNFLSTLDYSQVNSVLGIFSGAHIGDTLDLKDRLRAGRPFDDGKFSYNIAAPRQEVQHHIVKWKLDYKFNEKWSGLVQYNFQYNRRKEFDLRRQSLADLPSIDLKLAYQGLEALVQYQSENWRHQFGVQGDLYVNNNTPNLHTTPIIPNYDAQSLGLFALSKWTGKNSTVEAGLRMDHYQLDAAGFSAQNRAFGGNHTFQKLNGSIGYRHYLKPGLTYSTNLGTAWRPPSVNELYSAGLHHGAAQYELGDSTLQAEQSAKWSHSILWQHEPSGWSVQGDVFAQYFDQYIYLEPSGSFVQSLRGAFPVLNNKATEAFFWGIDLSGLWAINKAWTYEVKASMLRAKDISHQRYLPFIPSDRMSHTLNYKKRLKGKVSEWGAWTKVDAVAQQHRYLEGSDYAPPPPGYALCSAGIFAGIKWGKNTWRINLLADNLSNNQYKDYLNRYRYYAHDIGRNIQLKINYIF